MVEPKPTSLLTEDGKRLNEGDRCYNYYDMKAGVIVPGTGTMLPDAWFDIKHDDGTTAILNGQRICTTEYAKRRGFKDA